MKIGQWKMAKAWELSPTLKHERGAWKAFVNFEKQMDKVQEPRIMDLADGGRIGFKYGEGVQQIIKNSVGSPYGEGYHIMDYYSKEDAVPAKGGRGGKTRNLYVKDYDEAVAALEKKTLRKSKAGIKLTKAEADKINKILKNNGKGAGIFEYGGKDSGKYNIKIKVEKDGKILQKNFVYTGDDSLKNALDYHTEARAKLFPNQISDGKFKELRLLNDTLTDAQFADLLNESNYLTSKGNRFNATTAFNWKKRLDLGSLGPRTFRTIEEAEKVVKEKFGKNFKQIFKNDSEIFAKATQLINDKGKFKGSFPRGAGAEDFLWHSFNRAAKGGSKQITYDLSALGYELPVENGKINWNKKIDGTPAWKLVKFKDNDVGKTFSYNEKNGKHIIGDLKNQVNTAYNNTNKFNNAVKGFYEQAEIGQKFSGRLRDNFLIKELEAKMGRKITKADSELVDNWLASRRPGFSLTQVHHPEGVVKNVYNTQNVFTAANLKERDLEKIRQKEIKTLGEEVAQKNYNEGLQKISDEFAGIQKKVGSRYVGTAPTKEGLIKFFKDANIPCIKGEGGQCTSIVDYQKGYNQIVDEAADGSKKAIQKLGKFTKSMRALTGAAKWTGYGLLAEIGFMVPFAVGDYAAGKKWSRIIGNATDYGFGPIFGQSEQEEFEAALPEGSAAPQRRNVYELGERLERMEQQKVNPGYGRVGYRQRAEDARQNVYDSILDEYILNMQPFIRPTPHTEQGQFYDQYLMDKAEQEDIDAVNKIKQEDLIREQQRDIGMPMDFMAAGGGIASLKKK